MFARAIAPAEPRTVYEDAHVVVVDKPCGLLSVPGRGDALRDCAQARLRARHGDALTVVHRLDQDTSGLLLAAKDAATHAALQRAFALRAIDKRYAPSSTARSPASAARSRSRCASTSTIARARSTTRATASRRSPRGASLRAPRTQTRVALVPRTGRTHQLRVHAAHPLGLAAPIAGDRLYGRATSATACSCTPRRSRSHTRTPAPGSSYAAPSRGERV